MLLKEPFYYLVSQRRHAIPHRATRGNTRFAQEADAGSRKKHGPESLLCFLRDWQGRGGWEKWLRAG